MTNRYMHTLEISMTCFQPLSLRERFLRGLARASGTVKRAFGLSLVAVAFTATQPHSLAPDLMQGLMLGLSAASAHAEEPAARPVVEILAFGDSLTAGYGLKQGDGFVDQLEAWLNSRAEGGAVHITNAGVSGDTTSGGRARLDWTLSGQEPDLVILALGGNDVLRGIDPAITRDNMQAMMATLKEKGVPVLVAGMLAPPNLGDEYRTAFDSIYKDLAAQYGAVLYPFFLEGVAAEPNLNQADGIHPNPEGVKIIVSAMGPYVIDALESALSASDRPAFGEP